MVQPSHASQTLAEDHQRPAGLALTAIAGAGSLRPYPIRHRPLQLLQGSLQTLQELLAPAGRWAKSPMLQSAADSVSFPGPQ